MIADLIFPGMVMVDLSEVTFASLVNKYRLKHQVLALFQ